MKTITKAASLSQMLNSITNQVREAADEICDEAAKEVVDNVYAETQERVPVDTGELRSSGHTKKNDNGDHSVIYDDEKAFLLNYNHPTWQPISGRNGTVSDSRVQGNQKNYTKPGTGYLYMELSVDSQGNDQEIKKVITEKAKRRMK